MPSGLMRMLVPPSSRIPAQAAERVYMASLDQIPWPCRVRQANGELLIERSVMDSGKLYIPWQSDGYGEVTLCTGTLMERDRPYHLPVELARGKLNLVRHQIAEWLSIGLAVPPQVEQALHAALQHFAVAATTQDHPDEAAQSAQKAIEGALETAELLASCYVEQALAFRHRQTPKLPTLLGVRLGNQPVDGAVAANISKAFNAVSVQINWRDVEAQEGKYAWEVYDQQIAWCHANGLKVIGGPLLRMDNLGLPDWLALWEDDFSSLLKFISDFVQAAVTRYRGKIHLWQCAARANVSNVMSLGEEGRLKLAARVIELTRHLDPQTPAIIQMDQPWAEYMRQTEVDLSPLHFADHLVRFGLQLSGIGLELNMGYYPGGSYLRDRLDCSRLIDQWSCLGLPLHIMVTMPSAETPDPFARGNAKPLAGAHPDGWTAESQADWVKRFVPLLLSKPVVQSVVWNQLRDGQPHEFPHGGLIDAAGQPKPAFGALGQLRKRNLE
jgi:hypothetical protein